MENRGSIPTEPAMKSEVVENIENSLSLEIDNKKLPELDLLTIEKNPSEIPTKGLPEFISKPVEFSETQRSIGSLIRSPSESSIQPSLFKSQTPGASLGHES